MIDSRPIVLSRYFNNNLQFIAKKNFKCYGDSEVKIVSINLAFLKLFDKKIAKEIFGIDEQGQNQSFLGFTVQDVDESVSYERKFNYLIRYKMRNKARKQEKQPFKEINTNENENVDKRATSTDEYSRKTGLEDLVDAVKRLSTSYITSIVSLYSPYNNVGESPNENECIASPKRATDTYDLNSNYENCFYNKPQLETAGKISSLQLCENKLICENTPTMNERITACNQVTNTDGLDSNYDTHFIKDSQSWLDTTDEKISIFDPTSCVRVHNNNFEISPNILDNIASPKEAIKSSALDRNYAMHNDIDIQEEYLKTVPQRLFYPASTSWVPPRSPHNLIEELLHHDPWTLLVATIFLNKTNCTLARPYLFRFLLDYRGPLHVLDKFPRDFERYFVSLGLQRTRAVQVYRMSYDFVFKKWTSVKELYGIGHYGDCAFRMFCLGDFSVEPKDRYLRIYKGWYNKVYLKSND